MKNCKKEELALKVNDFLTRHSLDAKVFATSVGISIQELNEILTLSRLATEKEYAEIMIAMTIIEAKGRAYWLSMSGEMKSEIAAKFAAAGGSSMTIGGMIALISACGVPGLSTAGIASGLAAIGATVGGGMVAGIGICCAAPVLVGGVLYVVCKAVNKKFNNFKSKKAYVQIL